MNLTKDQIKEWLNHPDRSRLWLAKACGVSKNTVNNWLSTAIVIPKKQLIRISDLIENPKVETMIETPQTVEAVLVIKTTPEENEAWQKSAFNAGMTLNEWALCAIQSAYHAELEESKLSPLPTLDTTVKKQA